MPSPSKGWKKEAPGRHERTFMLARCGRKCFLGPGTSFPVCKRGTCSISQKGIHAAYSRARQWKHTKLASRAKRYLNSKKKVGRL